MNLKKKTMIVLFLAMVALGASAFVYSQDWPMVGHDPQNTGYSPSSGPSVGNLRWVYPTGEVVSPPVVADGKVYVGSQGGKIYCLDAETGASIWNYTATSGYPSSPVVVDNKVYVSLDLVGSVYCLDANGGSLIWETDFAYDSALSPPTVYAGNVYVSGESGWVYSLDAETGDPIGLYEPSLVRPSYTAPTAGEGHLFIAYEDGKVEVLSASNLVIFTALSVDANEMLSPAVAEGNVYISSVDRKVRCVDPNTGPVWTYQFGEDPASSPTVADGEVYIGLEYGDVYCLDAYTGTMIWQYPTGDDVASTAVADGRVYLVSDKVYCLDADTGDWIWDYTIGEVLTPLAVADEKVYVASDSGNIYCLGSTLEERIASLEAENVATWINVRLLPGTRINILTKSQHQITAEETTHVWHGFRSLPWSTLTEEQRTEFLATAKWHLFVNSEEVSLDHVLIYDEENDLVWSIYYRVFPPGYFELDRNNKLVGNWFWMEDGEWDQTTYTATLRVR